MTHETDNLGRSTEGTGASSQANMTAHDAKQGIFAYTPQKGRILLVSIAVLYAVVFQTAVFFHSNNKDFSASVSTGVSSPIAYTVAEELPTQVPQVVVHGAQAGAGSAVGDNQDQQGFGGPISDYEASLTVDEEAESTEPSKVTVLEPVTSEETLIPTNGDAGHVELLASDLSSLASAPVVLTESTVGSGDTLIRVFQRNNLDAKHALTLANTSGAKAASVLYPGDQFKFVWSDNRLLGLELRRKKRLELMVIYDGSQFSIVSKAKAKQAGSLVKLLKHEIETVQQADLVDYQVKYAQIKQKELTWDYIKVKKGDTLSKLFRRVGLAGSLAVEIATYPGNQWLTTHLMPGQEVNVAKYDNGAFAILEVPDYSTAQVRLVFPVDDGYFAGFKQIETDQQEHFACSDIRNNLYEAAWRVNLPKPVVNEFVRLFDSRIDFSRQLRRGDEFCVIYERSYVRGKPLLGINIKAASLIQKDSVVQAFEHIDEDGKASYYDSQGISMQGHFLRSPIKYARVTSVYSESRYHPVLKKHRPHHGVDYGAKTGTPIRATATGRVAKRVQYKGYGKTIVLQHGSQYRTVYAHMSRFAKGTKVGTYVEQGQVIGYVGSTGVSTGPHLHYEFHVNGKHRDPLTYDMPKGEPIAEEYAESFQVTVNEYAQRLASIDEPQVEYRPTATQQTVSN